MNTIENNLQIIINNNQCISPLFALSNIEDEKDMDKFIKQVERQVRSSQEYRSLISYIKTELDYSHCTILDNISMEEASIELHHNALNLYDITNIVINKHIHNKTLFNTLSISLEVLQLHYRNILSLIPLSKTIHEYTHSNNIIYSPNQCIGNLSMFYDEYKDYFNDRHLQSYDRYMGCNDTTISNLNISNKIQCIEYKD